MASVRWRLEKQNDECSFSQLESEFVEYVLGWACLRGSQDSRLSESYRGSNLRGSHVWVTLPSVKSVFIHMKV